MKGNAAGVGEINNKGLATKYELSRIAGIKRTETRAAPQGCRLMSSLITATVEIKGRFVASERSSLQTLHCLTSSRFELEALTPSCAS